MTQDKRQLDQSLPSDSSKENEIIKDEAWALMVELYPNEFSKFERSEAATILESLPIESQREWLEIRQDFKDFNQACDDYVPELEGPYGLSDSSKDQLIKFAINIAESNRNHYKVEQNGGQKAFWYRILTPSQPIAWAFVIGLALIGTWSFQKSFDQKELGFPFQTALDAEKLTVPSEKSTEQAKLSDNLDEDKAIDLNLLQQQSSRSSNNLIIAHDEAIAEEEPVAFKSRTQQDNQGDSLDTLVLEAGQTEEVTRPKVNRKSRRVRKNIKPKTSKRVRRQSKRVGRKVRSKKTKVKRAPKRSKPKSRKYRKESRKPMYSSRSRAQKSKNYGMGQDSESIVATLDQSPQTKSATKSSPPPVPNTTKGTLSSVQSTQPKSSTSYGTGLSDESSNRRNRYDGKTNERSDLETKSVQPENVESEEGSLNDADIPPPPWQGAVETWAQGRKSDALIQLLQWIDQHPSHPQRMTAIRLGRAWARTLKNKSAMMKLDKY